MNLYQRFIRATVWVVLRFIYRIEVRHVNRIPRRAAVLAPNHVTFLDAVLIAAHLRRPVAFAMYWKIYNRTAWLVKPLGAFPIAGKDENREIYDAAFRHMHNTLFAGDLVCIFPEGMLTLDGELNPFKGGIQKLVARQPEPVVPVALKGLWGTLFSKYKRGGKLPDRWMSKISMDFGQPIAPADVGAKLEPTVRKMLER